MFYREKSQLRYGTMGIITSDRTKMEKGERPSSEDRLEVKN